MVTEGLEVPELITMLFVPSALPGHEASGVAAPVQAGSRIAVEPVIAFVTGSAVTAHIPTTRCAVPLLLFAFVRAVKVQFPAANDIGPAASTSQPLLLFAPAATAAQGGLALVEGHWYSVGGVVFVEPPGATSTAGENSKYPQLLTPLHVAESTL